MTPPVVITPTPAVFTLPNANVYAPGWRADTTTATPYVETQHPGEYMKFDVQGTTKVALNVDAAPLDNARIDPTLYPVVRAVVDGTEGANVQVPVVGGSLTLAMGLSAARHHVRVEFVTGNDGGERWTNPPNILRVTGLTLDANGAALPASGTEARRAHLALFYTDSLGELDTGSGSNALRSDATRTYPTLLSDALGWEHEHIAFSGEGFVNTYASTNAPPLFTPGDPNRTTFDKFDARHSRLDSGQLAADDIFVSLGTNDGLGASDGARDSPVSDDALALRVQQTLAAIRVDNASARLWVILPLTRPEKRQAIADGTAAYRTAHADARCFTLDIGTAAAADLRAGETLDGIHLTPQGQQDAAQLLLPLIRQSSGT